jgi:biopolymer transport protein ExbD
MAEIQDSGGGDHGKKGKVRSKKASTHVDMTAMVDLAFLLLTFFLLTTTFNKPQTMEIIMPDKTEKKEDQSEVKESNALTLILGENNRIYWYTGLKEPKVEVTYFGPTKIRKLLVEKRDEVAARGGKNKLTVLIKADDKAKYKNFVDILDEMNINKIPTYAVVDITPQELEMIAKAQTAPASGN